MKRREEKDSRTIDREIGRRMGKEVIKVAPDKKSDCIVNCTPKCNSDQANYLSSNPTIIVDSNKAIKGKQGDENSHRGQEAPYLRNVSMGQDAADSKHSTQKSSNQKKSPWRPATGINALSSHTVSQPPALATKKRASGGNRVFVAEATGSGDKTARADDPQSSNVIKNTESNSPVTSEKPLKPDNTMHPDTDDSCSIVSSTAASVRTSKGRIVVPTAPTFRCSERADKRKEFYSKLEQKHKALEAEKSQSEARMREDQEAALKQLRKSLTFKANPIPSFYYEGPPAKVELKKALPTRAKSPKFTQRKSHGDANPAEEDYSGGVCGRLRRHSLGTTTEAAKKLQSTPKNVKVKEGLKSNGESSKPVVVEVTD